MQKECGWTLNAREDKISPGRGLLEQSWALRRLSSSSGSLEAERGQAHPNQVPHHQRSILLGVPAWAEHVIQIRILCMLSAWPAHCLWRYECWPSSCMGINSLPELWKTISQNYTRTTIVNSQGCPDLHNRTLGGIWGWLPWRSCGLWVLQCLPTCQKR